MTDEDEKVKCPHCGQPFDPDLLRDHIDWAHR